MTNMRILVTGVTGFAGGHLAEALLRQGGVEVFGAARRADWPGPLRHLAGPVRLHACDLADGSAVEALLREVRPEQVYHLAGYAQTGQSLREVGQAWAGNLTATLSLYEAVVRWGERPRILYVGSGLIYGEPERPDQAYDEQSPLRPANPYAASKAAADLAGYQYTRFPGLNVVRARPFNHIGPRQSPRFAAAHFAEQIAAVEKGLRPPFIETGNLQTFRDLTDVRDTVRAYQLLMEHGRTGEAYNVATGVVHSMQEILDHLLALCGTRVEVRAAAQLMRAADSTVVRGDASKLRRETGWQPRYTLQETLRDTLEFWKGQHE